jgi:hypothetical protein
MIFKSARRYGDFLNSYDTLKLLALLSMVFDHLGNYFFSEDLFLRALGRYAFPAFLFLVGYSGYWKIKPDIIIYMLVIALVTVFTRNHLFPINILLSIIVARFAMQWIERTLPLNTENLVKIYIISLFLWLFTALPMEYGSIGLLFAMCGLLQRRQPGSRSTIVFMLATFAIHLLIESYTFRFNAVGFVVMLLLFTLLLIQFSRFSLRPVNAGWMPVPLRHCLQWLSHNALLFYLVHVVAFMLLGYYLYPAHITRFKWMM